ncbi:MAG: oligosaccharide flippase family protein, partial [Patescibacteria group bacterium]|nr:oligosaccharide flippase family protein [Patescibacteria group bacterium]
QGAGLIYQIIFPIFSSIQNNSSRLKRGVLKSLGITFIFSLFFGLFIYKFSPILIELILGKEWLPMIPALNILIIFGILRPLISVGVALFDAVGQPNLTATVNLIKLIALVIFIFPLIHKFGIIGVAWAVVIAQIAVYPWFIVKLVKTLK